MNHLSVTRLLESKYGVNGRPGAKTECPECGKNTLSIKRDDSIARCFHPSCNKFFRPGESRSPGWSAWHVALDHIRQDLRRELQRQEKEGGKAWRYLTKERMVHPGVIRDAQIGAVPSNYDADLHTGLAIARFKNEIAEMEAAQKEKKGRPTKAWTQARDRMAAHLESLKASSEALSERLKYTGNLVFFHGDAQHRVMSMRFRPPYSKRMYTWKHSKRGGVFGHDLFSPIRKGSKPLLDEYNGTIFVCEGEFNTLQLQSMIRRCAEAKKVPFTYANSCAVGSSSGPDLETVRKISRRRIFLYDNDDAGFALLEKARELMTIEVAGSPEEGEDLDEYLRGFPDPLSAEQGLKRLLESREPMYRSFGGVKKEICICRMLGGKGFLISRDVAEMIVHDLEQRGEFYYDGTTPYLFLAEDKVLFPIKKDDPEVVHLLHKYGQNRSEKLYDFLVAELQSHAQASGVKTTVHVGSHYDSKRHVLYVYNHAGQVYRITDKSKDLVDNGSDGVLFLRVPGAEPFEYLDRTSKGIPLFSKHIAGSPNFSSGRVKADEKRLLMELWLYSNFFRSIMPTKPILAFIGPKGSGKSVTPKKMGKILVGPGFNVSQLTEDVRDFDAAVSNSHFVAIDNADSPCKWLPDRLAVVSTGGVVSRRAYYTTNQLEEFETRAALVITSRTPDFTRDDVADRLLIMNVERFTEFIPESQLMDELLRDRNGIWSEVLDQLQLVVRALKKQASLVYKGGLRMSDFASFATKFLVEARGWSAGKVQDLFERVGSEQASFSIQDDPLVQMIIEWAWSRGRVKISNRGLLEELHRHSSDSNFTFEYTGRLHAFSMKMNKLRPSLEQYFKPIEMTKAHRGTRLWTYELKDDFQEQFDLPEAA